MSDKSGRFPHHHLHAYQLAVQCHRYVVSLRRSMRAGLGDLYDQLKRASTSACLNLAEGRIFWNEPQDRLGTTTP